VSFGLPSSAGSTEYFVTKTVTNNTSSAWISFRIDFGCGSVGKDPCPFNPLTGDYDLAPTSSAGGTLTTQAPTEIRWDGLNILPGNSVNFTFSVDLRKLQRQLGDVSTSERRT
jgi:hypothetical protein